MAHEIDKEKLSAYVDGELRPDPELLAHLSACRECSAYVARLKSAISDFKRHGAERIPPELLGAILANAKANAKKGGGWAPTPPMVKMQLVLTLTLAAAIVVGLLLKKIAPGIFTQIQGMISGASNNLGQ
jgi:anti-sigma factor RsiW